MKRAEVPYDRFPNLIVGWYSEAIGPICGRCYDLLRDEQAAKVTFPVLP
jgi:hypothetical protein